MRLLFTQTDFLFLLPCQAVCIWSVSRFCQKYMTFKKSVRLLFPTCLFFGWIFLYLLGESCAVPQIPYIFLVLLKHLLFTGTVLCFFQSPAEKKLLISSVLITVLTLTENFCESFLSCLALLVLRILPHIQAAFPQKQEEFLISCIRTAAASLTLFQTSIYFDPEILFSGKTRQWHIILAAPLLGITAVVDLANWSASNGILVRSSTETGSWYDQLFSHGGMCLLTALSIFAAACYLFGIERISLEQQKNSQNHAQLAIYQMLEEQYRQSERLRHDMKNHIIALSGLLTQEDWKKCREYLENMAQSADLGTGEEATGNGSVDALLYQKRKLAENNRIRWECDVQIPQICGIPEFDLCVLFGNLLDNALQACLKISADQDRFVSVHAGLVKQCFLLDVKNSMRPEYTDEVPPRKKHPVVKHGIGLLNVQDIIHKYDGTWKIERQNQLFVISLLLPAASQTRT